MAAGDDQPETFQTTSEESQRQAEAAFGGATPTAPVGVPGTRRQRPWLRTLIVAFVVFDVVVAVGVGAYLLVKSAVDDNTNPRRTIPSLPGVPSVPGIPTPPETPSQPPKPAKPTAPSGSTSNFTIAGLSRSKATARKLAGPSARIDFARVSESQLQVIARNGSRRKVVLVSSAITRAIDTPGTTLTGNEFSFEAFSPAVMARILRGLDRTYHVRAAGIDYIVLLGNPATKSLEWLVYPKGGGGHFQADARGGSLRRIG